MNEAETRAELIDPLLVAAGWGVVEGTRIRREFPIAPGRIEGGGRGKSLSADYALSYRNTALAVVEAKADSLPLTEDWPGQGIRRQAPAALHLRQQRQGHQRHRQGNGRGGGGRSLPQPPGAVATHLRRRERLARSAAILIFVLQHDVTLGVQELALEKLTPLLQLRYQNSIADAVADLGRPEDIGQLFAGFQRYLYAASA
jgi:hypothetical protein